MIPRKVVATVADIVDIPDGGSIFVEGLVPLAPTCIDNEVMSSKSNVVSARRGRVFDNTKLSTGGYACVFGIRALLDRVNPTEGFSDKRYGWRPTMKPRCRFAV